MFSCANKLWSLICKFFISVLNFCCEIFWRGFRVYELFDFRFEGYESIFPSGKNSWNKETSLSCCAIIRLWCRKIGTSSSHALQGVKYKKK